MKEFNKDKAPKAAGGKGGKRFPKKRVCQFCVNKASAINYITFAKEATSNERTEKGEKRTRYVTEKGKIIPRRMSGVCLAHQRLLAVAVKRARIMGLLPHKAD
jgi:small subunit ribosomal protein S18